MKICMFQIIHCIPDNNFLIYIPHPCSVRSVQTDNKSLQLGNHEHIMGLNIPH